MKAINIYPEDIGCSTEWSEKWVKFIRKFGYEDGTPWGYVTLVNIEIL